MTCLWILLIIIPFTLVDESVNFITAYDLFSRKYDVSSNLWTFKVMSHDFLIQIFKNYIYTGANEPLHKHTDSLSYHFIVIGLFI